MSYINIFCWMTVVYLTLKNKTFSLVIPFKWEICKILICNVHLQKGKAIGKRAAWTHTSFTLSCWLKHNQARGIWCQNLCFIKNKQINNLNWIYIKQNERGRESSLFIITLSTGNLITPLFSLRTHLSVTPRVLSSSIRNRNRTSDVLKLHLELQNRGTKLPWHL